MFENPRRGRQAKKFTTNVPEILGLKSSSEQIFSENCRWVPLSKGLCAYTTTLQLDHLFFPFRLEQLLHTSLLYFGALTRSGKELIVTSEFFAAYNIHRVQT